MSDPIRIITEQLIPMLEGTAPKDPSGARVGYNHNRCVEALREVLARLEQAEARAGRAEDLDRANVVLLQGNVEQMDRLKERMVKAEREQDEAREEASQCELWRDRYTAVSVVMGDRDGDVWPSTHDLPERVAAMRARIAELEAEIARLAHEAEQTAQRVRAIWPHIEIPGSATYGKRVTYDPGPPTCIRCKIEEALRGEA